MCEDWELETPVDAMFVCYEEKMCIDAAPVEHRQRLRESVQGVKTTSKVIYKNGLVQFSNHYLQANLDVFVNGKGWQEKKSMQALADKLSYFRIAHAGACKSMEGVPSNVDGKVRYGRGWEFDLDKIRRALCIDVETTRRIRVISRHKMMANRELSNAEFEMKRFDTVDGDQRRLPHEAQRSAKARFDAYSQWLTFLDGRINMLNKPKTESRGAAFDAETHFEEVWNHEAETNEQTIKSVLPAAAKELCETEPVRRDHGVGDAATTEERVTSSRSMPAVTQFMPIAPIITDVPVRKRAMASIGSDGNLSESRKLELMNECVTTKVRKV